MNPEPIKQYERPINLEGKDLIVKIICYASPIKKNDLVRAHTTVVIENNHIVWGTFVLKDIVEEEEVDGVMEYIKTNYLKFKL